MDDIIELQELETSLIHHFVTENNLTGLEEIVLQRSDDIDKYNEARQTALHLACELGNVEATEFLIRHGASVVARDHNEFTPLIAACFHGKLECAIKIQEELSGVDHLDKNGWSSLMWSVYKGHAEVVKFLLEHGANANISVAYNATCLLWAAGRGYLEIVELLCDWGARIDHVDRYGNTAIIWAARRGYTDIIQCLLGHNADPNIVGANGFNSLIMAVKEEQDDCAAMLLKNSKVHVNQTDQDGRTALSHAAKRGSVATCKLLLGRGAYLNLPDSNGDTPLIRAVKYAHLEVVKVLLSHFADVDVKGKDRKTALHFSCENGNIPIIRELLKCGCKIECTNSNKETPLLRAVKEGNVKVAKVLLNSGSDVSVCDQDGNTCVHIAIRGQNINLVELILQNPKHARFLYQENKHGETPYDIDLRSNKKILSQLFGSKGFSTAAMTNDSTLDVTSCSLAEMLSEPMLEPPICIGLYAKWGNNVTFMLNKIRDQIELFSCPSLAFVTNMFWLTLAISFYFAIVISVLMAFLLSNRILAGFLTFFTIFTIFSFLAAIIYIGIHFNKWSWTKSANKSLHALEDYLKMLLQISFVRQTPSSGGRVRYIFSECMNITSFKENDLLSGLTSILLQSTEKSIGKLAFRIARALPSQDSSHVEGNRAFRKLCCFPSFILLLVWVNGFTVLLMLIVGLYGPASLHMSVEARFNAVVAMCIIAIILGCILVMCAPVLWNISSSLLFSTKKIKSKLSNELSQNRSEINRLAQALSIVDAIKKTKTRICLLVNGLDINDQRQLCELVHAIHTVYSARPIVMVMCIDYHFVTAALQNSDSSLFDGDLKGNNFVQYIVQLPLFLPDKKRKKHLMNDEQCGTSDTDNEERDAIRRKKYPKHFDVTKWLISHDCFQPANPLLIKRVASIISFTARLLRSAKKDFSWAALSSWVVLSELWAYSTTCMIVYISRKSISPSKLLKSLYCEIRHLISSNHSMDIHDSYWLQQFITSKSCTLSVADVINFHRYTMNLDPSLEDIVPTFNDSWTVHTCSTHELSTMASSQLSMMSVDDAVLTDWTVDDVCRRLKSIPGLDASNVQYYHMFVHKNNFHGLALSLCDVDELKKELKTSFGDWCLIKKFIIETKRSFHVVNNEHHSFPSLASNGKKSTDTGIHHEEPLTDDDNSPSVLSGLDRVAYNKAFKEYLKLQPQISTARHNATHDVVIHGQLANDNSPLLEETDVNAN